MNYQNGTLIFSPSDLTLYSEFFFINLIQGLFK